PAVASLMCHTDVDDYPALCPAAGAALSPGGRFAHVGVPPCFIGAFADRADPERVVLAPGDRPREPPFQSLNAGGRRARAGARPLPLPAGSGAVAGGGLGLAAVRGLGEPTPDMLAIRAHRRVTAAG